MLALLWALAGGVATTSPDPARLCDAPIQTLDVTAGLVLERPAPARGCDLYRVRGAGPVRVTVEEQGVDLSLLLPSAGEAPLRLDSGAGRHWLETALVDATGAFAVISSARGGDTTHYRLRVEHVDPEGNVAAALRLTRVALAKPRGVEAGRMAEDTGRAAEAWLEAGLPREAAWLRLVQARRLYDAGQVDGSLRLLVTAESYLADPTLAAWRLRIAGERATTLTDAGRTAGVEPLLTAAIQEAGSLNEPGLLAHLRIRLGLLCQATDRLDQARGEYEQAAALLRLHPDPRLEAMVANNLAGLHLMLGEPAPAFRYFDRARELAEEFGDLDGVGTILTNAAYLHGSLGQYDLALEKLSKALEIFEGLGRDGDVALALSATGKAYLGLGEPGRAADYLEQARRRAEAAGDMLAAAAASSKLGDARRMLGDPEAARRLHEEVLARYEQAGRRSDAAGARISLAADAIAAGRYGDAAAGLEPAIAVLRDLSYRQELAQALYQRGVALDGLGRTREARLALGEAEALQDALGDRQARVPTLTWRARVAAHGGRLEEALALATAAADLLDDLRGEVSNPDLRASLFGTHREPYDELVRLHMRARVAEPGTDHLLAALAAVERGRARSLRESLARAGPAALEPGQATARRQLLEQANGRLMRLRMLNRALDEARAGPGEDGTETRRLGQQIAATEQALRRLRLELDALDAAASTGPAAALMARDARPALEALLAGLPTDTALLSYHLADEESWAWLLRRDSIEAWPLPPATELEPAIALAAGDASQWQPDESSLARRLAGLGALLLPAPDRLSAIRRLFIVPDSTLHYLPFAALPAPGAPGRRLIDAYEVVHAPALSILGDPHPATPPWHTPARIAVFADPVLDLGPPAIVVGGPDAGLGAILQRLGPLPFSEEEAAAIRALGGERVTLFTGAAASKATLAETDLREFGLIHFATHAVSSRALPEFAGLVLSQRDALGREVEGLLHLEEIYRLPLAAELVVLSACRTARGREFRGEGPMSLGRAFMVAGASRVLITQWDVPDDVSALLVEALYAGMLQQGLEPAAALRRAQLRVRDRPGLEHPFYWAGFILATTRMD